MVGRKRLTHAAGEMNALRIQKAKPQRASRTIIRTLLGSCASFLHQKTLGALLRGVEALLAGNVLSVTALGRGRAGKASAKHRIKALDRLVGNPRLVAKSAAIYRGLALRWLGYSPGSPIILVDWTCLKNGFHCLSASVAFQGRSVPLYAEVHPEKKLANHRVHKQFLGKLAQVLPASCRPVVVTDAGFYTEWCDAVEAHGWQFVARVRNQTKYRPKDSKNWVPVKQLFDTATTTARSTGPVFLTKGKPRLRRLVTVRKKPAIGRKPSKGHSTTANKHRKAAKEPWVLATNHSFPAKDVVRIYGYRMQIEQNYRDLKNSRWGWHFSQSGTRSAERFTVLVLIAVLAIFVVLLLGFAAENQGLHRGHQANTIKTRRVLSLFCLGKRILAEHASLCFDFGEQLRTFAAAIRTP